MKSVISSASPWKQEKPAVKDIKYKKTRNLEIFKQNQVLLYKMMKIEQHDSNLHPVSIGKKLYNQKSSSINQRLRDYNSINAENKVMLGRLQSAKSNYHKDSWMKNI